MKTRDWTIALRAIAGMEAEPQKPVQILTVAAAIKEYLEDCAARHLAPSTITSYRNVLVPFGQYCENRNLREVRGLRLDEFRGFRAYREVSVKTQRKEIEHLRAFCAFCVQHGWLKENYGKLVRMPEDDGPITMPYEREEIDKLLAACEQIANFDRANTERSRKRARALVLLLLYGGLRISDAVRLERSRVDKNGRILMYAMKTGVPLYVKLHPDCVSALRELPLESPYFLWSGKSKITTATGSARRTVACISRLSGVRARPHRFRDTFAVELLLAGEDIRTVQLLLGHKSIKTTEKHYAPFVRRFQQRLDEATAKLHFGPSTVSIHDPQHPAESSERS